LLSLCPPATPGGAAPATTGRQIKDFPITAENVSRIQPFVTEELELDGYTWMLSNEPVDGTD